MSKKPAARQSFPREGTFTLFALSQPWDIKPAVIFKQAQDRGYTVIDPKAITKARWLYPHLEWFSNQRTPDWAEELRVQGPKTRDELRQVAARVVEDSMDAVPSELAGRAKEILERATEVVMNVVTDPIPEGPKGSALRKYPNLAKMVGTSTGAPPPPAAPKPPAPAQEEEDMASLQQLRDSFELKDWVRQSKTAGNGQVLTREGQIIDKEATRAVVRFGSGVQERIPYKQLSLAPRLSGRGSSPPPEPVTRTVDTPPPALRVVPPALAQLAEARTMAARAQAPTPEPPAPPPAPPAPPPQPEPAAAPPAPAPAPAQGGIPADVKAWLEMGASMAETLQAAERALRAEAGVLSQQIDALTIERDAKLHQANTLQASLAAIAVKR